MAEVAEERNPEIEQRVEVEEHEETSENELQEANSSFLPELNLLLVVLSLCPFPSEDELDHTAEKAMEHVKDVEPKVRSSRLHSKRREMNPPNFAGRQAQRLQPITMDCRHGRKL